MLRFDRNMKFFGHAGQQKLKQTHVVIVGVGGLGTHVVQQLALLGVGSITLIDDEDLSLSNKNRYIGAKYDDAVPGSRKVQIAGRLIKSIDPAINTTEIPKGLVSETSFAAIKRADYIFGCLDDDGARFILNDLATAYAKFYLDLASDIIDGNFGGRILFKTRDTACLFCAGELDRDAISHVFETAQERANRASVYGILKEELSVAGPSVVSINGTIASLGVTEFLACCVGLRAPKGFVNYDGLQCSVRERRLTQSLNCPYCAQWGLGDEVEPHRYLCLEANGLHRWSELAD